jgi:hypothetical protein
MTKSYAKLRDDTVVTANFTGGLPLSFVAPVIKRDYVKDPYYEGRTGADVNYEYADIVVTNNVARYAGEDTELLQTKE